MFVNELCYKKDKKFILKYLINLGAMPHQFSQLKDIIPDIAHCTSSLIIINEDVQCRTKFNALVITYYNTIYLKKFICECNRKTCEKKHGLKNYSKINPLPYCTYTAGR